MSSFYKTALWVFRVLKYPKKVFGGFDNIFHVYLMREFQKYGRNWILTVAFWGQTKAVQKCAARWDDWLCYFAIVRIQFLSYFWNPLIMYTWKTLSNPPNTFFWYFNTLETHSVVACRGNEEVVSYRRKEGARNTTE